ncbi:MAG TPA: hypothetical protein VJ508_01775, partial [Saprospiraceae bacterium]|nr:hypothetical protein [Saprospiraceae bacterium]
LLLILSWPAFKYYFFAEAFTYLRIYNQHNRHLVEAAFSRMDGMFFRPGFFLVNIWWHFVLPPDPMLYHVRNAIFCVINLFLLYVVLSKFIRSRPARIIALGIVAVSKIHMTIIGYIVVYEASVLLMTILLVVLFWFRYIEARRKVDYVVTIIVCVFSAYSKDNGFVVIGILAAMVIALAVERRELMSQLQYWAVRFIPFVIISASYLVLRYVLTGPLNLDNQWYSPRFSFSGTVRQMAGFLATAGNLSLTDRGVMGKKGLVSVLGRDSMALEFALCLALWILILFTLWLSRARWRLLIVPLVWIGLYLFPIFLIRNHQVYYYQEPLVGLALMMGISLDRAKRPLLMAWFVVVAVIATNGFITNRTSYNAWQYTSDRAAEIVKPIVAAQKQDPPSSIVFVSSPALRDFWTFAIGGPLVPQLLGSPETKVSVVDSATQISPDAQVCYLPE